MFDAPSNRKDSKISLKGFDWRGPSGRVILTELTVSMRRHHSPLLPSYGLPSVCQLFETEPGTRAPAGLDSSEVDLCLAVPQLGDF